MSYKWNPEKKWIDFMNKILWKSTSNWNMVDDKFLHKEIPLAEEWARKNIARINDHDIRSSFKRFFWSDKKMSQHDYTRKNQAIVALGTLYSYQQEQEHDRS